MKFQYPVDCGEVRQTENPPDSDGHTPNMEAMAASTAISYGSIAGYRHFLPPVFSALAKSHNFALD